VLPGPHFKRGSVTLITQIAHSNEKARLAAVESVAWTPARADHTLDDIVAMAAEAFGVAIAVVSLTESEAQSAIAAHGVARVAVPREASVCTQTVAGGATLIVTDATADERTRDNPFVVNTPFLRFYAGCVLRSADGHALGTLCILDTKPRTAFSEEDRRQLERFARLAEQRLQARALQKRLVGADEARFEAEAYAQHILKEAIGAFVACDRLSLNLEGRVRARLMRVQRECSTGGLRAAEEAAALSDLIDEMAAVARLDRKDAKAGLFEPSAVVRDVAGDLGGYAHERKVEIELRDDAAGVEMLGDTWRFEELIEAALSDCIDATRGPIAVRCAFESLPSGEELFAVRLSAEKSEKPWRLSARNRELIDAMAGSWELSGSACALALFLPARLRTTRPATRQSGGNIVSFDRSRKGSR
jgi:GAF domain-containing protein